MVTPTIDPATIRAATALRSPLGQISLAGYSRDGRGVPRRPLRVLGSYAVVYVVDGGGEFEDVTGLALPVVAGDLLLIFPEIAHTYGPTSHSRWTELFLVFDGPVFDLWRETGLLDPRAPLLHLEPIELWTSRFESILGAPRQPGFAPSLLEVCRLQAVLGEALLGGARRGANDEQTAWLRRACALLDSDFNHELDLHDLARDLNMSYDGFRKRFRRHLGVAPARYRAARIADRACQLIRQGHLTDKQIAAQLGFCDEFYFSRRFKQITGRSPRQYRTHLPPIA